MHSRYKEVWVKYRRIQVSALQKVSQCNQSQPLIHIFGTTYLTNILRQCFVISHLLEDTDANYL